MLLATIGGAKLHCVQTISFKFDYAISFSAIARSLILLINRLFVSDNLRFKNANLFFDYLILTLNLCSI